MPCQINSSRLLFMSPMSGRMCRWRLTLLHDGARQDEQQQCRKCRFSSAGSSSACSGSRVGRVFVLNPCGTSMTSMVPVLHVSPSPCWRSAAIHFLFVSGETLRSLVCPWWRWKRVRVRCSTKRACAGASSTHWRLRQAPTVVFGIRLCVSLSSVRPCLVRAHDNLWSRTRQYVLFS